MYYLKWLRLRRGITQTQASKLAGVSLKTWWNYEHGMRPQGNRRSCTIANALCGQLAFVSANIDDAVLSDTFDNLMEHEWFGKFQSDCDEDWSRQNG